ncbi:helix-turn-helix domain-containing protein [Gordonia hongkongensis]|uniref:helix-turn-helix domain-containing protein n=1 Tax=Gordonia hongkongensis TaxID=1701090 RepID=UPI003D75DEB8
MPKRTDWPLGPALKAARERAGISARKAADRTNGLVSSGRWYQLESGVQKTKGQEVPIGTTPETVVAAALAVGWDVDDALRVAGMTATESMVRVIETKMFGPEIRSAHDEPDWMLYLEAVLEYIDHHPELDASEVGSLLIESEFLAKRAIATRPDISEGIDRSIAYGARINHLLTELRDKQQSHHHGLETRDDITTEPTTASGTSETPEGQKSGAAGRRPSKLKALPTEFQGEDPDLPPIEQLAAESGGAKGIETPPGEEGYSQDPDDHPGESHP